ncbi:MAG TPA: hypothetical protein VFY87_10600, partial [Geminicoccaceae bacterium]|nr:hypothetical protein [Geminicoccaceae bacterium]
MGAEVVHHERRVGLGPAQLGWKDLLQLGAGHRAVGGCLDARRGHDAADAERAPWERRSQASAGSSARTARTVPRARPLPARAAPVGAGHGR